MKGSLLFFDTRKLSDPNLNEELLANSFNVLKFLQKISSSNPIINIEFSKTGHYLAISYDSQRLQQ